MFQAAFNMCINFIYSSIGPIFWRSIYFTTNFIMNGLDKYQSMKESGTFWVSFCFISSGLINLAHNLRTLFLYIFSFAASIGGQMGLFIGASVLTMMEFVEILCLMFIFIVKRLGSKRGNSLQDIEAWLRRFSDLYDKLCETEKKCKILKTPL